MHSEYGFITVENGTRNLVMNTVMSNGQYYKFYNKRIFSSLKIIVISSKI